MKAIIAAIFSMALPATVEALRTNILIPLYVYPVPGAWDRLYEAIKKCPSLEFQIVLNPSSGPGSSSVGFDSNWINATSIINSYHNTRTFGYVHLLGGDEPIQDIEANVTQWASWNSYSHANLSIHGIFFDETPDNDTVYMQNLTDFAHAKLGSSSQIIFNPGKVVYDDLYFTMADHVIVSEVQASTYTTSVPSQNVAPQYASRASILVYEFASSGGTSSDLKTWLDGMVKTGIGSVNVVDYGWDASTTGDSPADIGTVAELLVEAGAISHQTRRTFAIMVSGAMALTLIVC